MKSHDCHVVKAYCAHKLFGGKEYVPCGEVAMNNPLLSQILHGVGDLDGVRVEKVEVLVHALFLEESVQISTRSQLLYL